MFEPRNCAGDWNLHEVRYMGFLRSRDLMRDAVVWMDWKTVGLQKILSA